MRLLPLTSALALAVASLVLSGCAGMTSPVAPAPVTVTASSALKGLVYGGRQPIANANLTLYETGTAGYGSAPKSLQTTTTNGSGNFAFAGGYTCDAGTDLYIVSNGGDPEGNGEDNTDATLMAGLTSCADIGSITQVWISEVTTVGTVWALAPFMNGVDIGAPASNEGGLDAAFGDINTLVNITNGSSPGPGLPAGTTVPTPEINALADVLATCVNSDVTGGPSNTCTTLFNLATPPGGSTPSDTVGAAVDIARNPGHNAQAIINQVASQAPYGTTFTSANDLTIGVTYTTGSISNPSALAVDGGGNVWVASNSATPAVTELSHAGVVQGTYTAGSLNGPSAIAIDIAGDAWIANKGNSTITELAPGVTQTGTSPYSGEGLSSPTGIAFDGVGNVWVSNSGNNSASEFSSTGTAIGNYTATGLNAPVGLALNPH